MNTPAITIEAIQFDGSNAIDILFWIKQNAKAGTDRKGNLVMETIHGKMRVEKGNTVVRVGFDMFAVIKHPISKVAPRLQQNVEIAITAADSVKDLTEAIDEIKVELSGKDFKKDQYFKATQKWSVELNPAK